MLNESWVRYKEIAIENRKTHQRKYNKAYYAKHREKADAASRRWHDANRVAINERRRILARMKPPVRKDPEYNLFRHQIRHYDEYAWLWEMLRIERIKDKEKDLPFQTHLTIKELNEITVNKYLLGNYSDLMPPPT
jgi:hypothetical protein